MHVIIGLAIGGAEGALQRLVESHRGSHEFDHVVVSLTTEGPRGETLKRGGTPVTAVGMRSVFSIPRTILRLRAVMRRERPDIVQTWMYHSDLLGGFAARSIECRNIVWGIRGTDVISGTGSATKIIRQLCALLSKRIPSVIVCASNSARRSHEAVGYDASRMIVIPNGYDAESLQPTASQIASVRATAKLSDSDLVIGCVGRFNPYKDHANFVAAAAKVAEHFPHARFLMIGADINSENAELSQLIQATRFADRFRLLGMRSDVGACYACMDVNVLSSRSEAFPNVVGEAMALRVPNVVTDVGDAALLVGDTGVVVPKEDATALASGIMQLLALPPADRRRFGERARQRIDDQFSMRHVQGQFESLFRSLVATS